MDHHLITQRAHNNELGFNTTRMTFVFGNIATIALNVLADLSSQEKLALSAFVVMLNIASFLSFDTELKIFAALSKDTGDENSTYAAGGKQTPWGAFRVFCTIICLVAAVTQLMAINA
jgi:hypothetical protein